MLSRGQKDKLVEAGLSEEFIQENNQMISENWKEVLANLRSIKQNPVMLLKIENNRRAKLASKNDSEPELLEIPEEEEKPKKKSKKSKASSKK